MVSEDGIRPCPSKVQAEKEWPVPKNQNDIRAFLGLASYYRKGVLWHWEERQQGAFQNLKDALTSDQVLAYPTGDGLFILDTDASSNAMGAVLSQVQNGTKGDTYASKTFSKSQAKYCTTKRELLAVVHFVTYFRSYVIGRHFRIRTDHASLIWLMNFKQSDNMYCNWIMKLEQYDYEIQHCPGVDHGNADGLSRMTSSKGRHCGKPDCSQCLAQDRHMSKPQQENLEKLRDDIVEQITRIKGLNIYQMGPGKKTGSGKANEGEVDWNEKYQRTALAAENFSYGCPANENGKCCISCSAYYVQPKGEGEEQDPLPDKKELVNLVQDGQKADEIVLDIVTRSKSRLKSANVTDKAVKNKSL